MHKPFYLLFCLILVACTASPDTRDSDSQSRGVKPVMEGGSDHSQAESGEEGSTNDRISIVGGSVQGGAGAEAGFEAGPGAGSINAGEEVEDPTGLRVIRITTLESPSDVAWLEVEVEARYVGSGAGFSNIASEASLSTSVSTLRSQLETAVDGRSNTPWVSEQLVPEWFQLSFPQDIELKRLRLVVGHEETGISVHEVALGSSVDTLETVQQISGFTSMGQFIEFPPTSTPLEPPPLLFNLAFRQTFQACDPCGFFFDWEGDQANKPRLVVNYEYEGDRRSAEYQHGLQGMNNAQAIWLATGQAHPESQKHQLNVRANVGRHGLFRVDASDLPLEAVITQARLFLHLNTERGLANGDHEGVLTIYENPQDWDWDTVSWTHASSDQPWDVEGGPIGEVVLQVHAGTDMHDRGFNKAAPDGYFDFTAFMQKLHDRRRVTATANP